jgi:hypothetical protein
MARKSLLDPYRLNYPRYDACDHATPVLYGADDPGLTLQKGRSPGLDTRNPRLHQIVELTTAGHEHFVGRTWELAGLGAEFIGPKIGAEVEPVALITGLGGMGKTALTAEALALWESRFEWVLLYQAKPNALGFDATLRDIHLKLYAELGRYYERVKSRPADAIYRAADAEFTGPERLERLTRNLVRALRDEALLLVLDNFENNLKPQAEPASTVTTSNVRSTSFSLLPKPLAEPGSGSGAASNVRSTSFSLLPKSPAEPGSGSGAASNVRSTSFSLLPNPLPPTPNRCGPAKIPPGTTVSPCSQRNWPARPRGCSLPLGGRSPRWPGRPAIACCSARCRRARPRSTCGNTRL